MDFVSPQKDLQEDSTIPTLQKFNEAQFGAGSTMGKFNKDGLFLGADKFSDAPFSVDYHGNMKSTSGTFSGDITGASGTFSGVLQAATIKAGDGTILVDSTGLNSYNNFLSSEISNSGTLSTNSTSFVTITGGAMNALTLSRTTRILIYANYYGHNTALWDSTSQATEVRIYDSNVGSIMGFGNTGTIGFHVSGGSVDTRTLWANNNFRQSIITLNAGTYTFEIQYRTTGGSSANCFQFNLGYVLLGN